MLGSDWVSNSPAGIALSLFAIAVLSVLLSYLATERPFDPFPIDGECQDAQRQYYRAKELVVAPQNKLPSGEEQEPNDERNHADVCAQHRMAEAAERGLWLLLGTFLFSATAAVAAWKTVRVMRETSQQQLRAYVTVTSFGLKAGFQYAPLKDRPWDVDNNSRIDNVSAVLSYKNSGQTPASLVCVEIRLALMRFNAPPTWEKKARRRFALATGEEGTITIGPVRVFDDWISDGAGWQEISGTICYLDVFRREQITHFKFESRDQARRGDLEFEISADGNDAS